MRRLIVGAFLALVAVTLNVGPIIDTASAACQTTKLCSTKGVEARGKGFLGTGSILGMNATGGVAGAYFTNAGGSSDALLASSLYDVNGDGTLDPLLESRRSVLLVDSLRIARPLVSH